MRILLLLVGALICQFSNGQHKGSKKEVDAILLNAQVFSGHIINANYEGIRDAYTSDAKIFPVNDEIMTGLERIIDYWKLPEGMSVIHHKIFPEEIVINQKTAYDHGYYEGITRDAKGQENYWKGKYVIVWKKIRGSWKMYLDIWNNVPTPQPAQSEIATQVDQIFENFNTKSSPGIALSVMKKGEVVLQKTYGMASLEYAMPITPNTVFNLCSVSKQFTVFALLLLEEQGKLSLDDDIGMYYPQLAHFDKPVTLRHLANNTSGYRDVLQLLGMQGFNPNSTITQEDTDAVLLSPQALNFEPGSQFGYSNSGFNLLANVVAKVSGVPFSTFIKEHLFNPLKMDESFAMDDFQRVVENKANSYALQNGSYQYTPSNYGYVGASGIYTTLKDLEKWAVNFSDLEVGSAAIVEKMRTPAQFNNGGMSAYGLGLLIDEYKGLKRIWHSGADAGYRSYIAWFPEHEVAVMLLSNHASIYAAGEALKVADLFLKPHFKEPAPQVKPQAATDLPGKSDLQDFSGNYIHTENFSRRKILVRNDKLIYSRPDQGDRESPLTAINKHSFQLGDWADTQVSFQTNGSLQQMTISIDGKEVDSYEQYEPMAYEQERLKEFEGQYYSEALSTEYTVRVENERIIIAHKKIGDIPLSPLQEDAFLSNAWQFQKVKFIRENGLVTGLELSSDAAHNVRFVRREH